jgi:replication factor C subunit 3/5
MAGEEYSIPWVEKYRPTNFEEIVMDPVNSDLFQKIIQKEYFPHLLFYGPPGTGKTTTIINLIQEYQKKHSRINKENIIHLNASDERGIDIIRNQIFSFVRSNNLFEKGLKFVILDEVDYMTKNAQHALKYLLQTTHTANVRFCLICNYISKIDSALKNEFTIVRFNQLPEKDIYTFIKQIAKCENIQITNDAIDSIQKSYCSDIRSMINYLQLNKDSLQVEWNRKICSKDCMITLHEKFRKNESCVSIIRFIHECSIDYNIDKFCIIQKYLNYIVRNHSSLLNKIYFDMIENVVHAVNSPIHETVKYFVNTNLHILHT